MARALPISAAMNEFGDTFPHSDAATVLFVILALGIIVFERMWEKLPRTARE